MSDGTINLPKRSTSPATPATDRYKIYVDGTDDEVKFVDDLGTVKTFKGDQGIQGIQGIQGVQGVQGDQGDQGDQGVQGDTGPSAGPNIHATTMLVDVSTKTATLNISHIPKSATGLLPGDVWSDHGTLKIV